MEAVKKGFGVLLLATAVWLVSPVIPAVVQMLAWAALLIIPAAIGAGVPLPSLSLALDSARRRGAPLLAVATSAVLVLSLLAIGEVAFELVFDARYKDFPYFPLTPIAVAVAVLAGLRRPDGAGVSLAEAFGLFGLLLAGLYIPLNETLKNWQALWFGVI
eukprot:gene19755-25273_t